MGRLRSLASSAKRQVFEDLREDPYLLAVLAIAFLLAGLYLWHEVPNFATWDERDRILDPLVVYGAMLRDPSIATLQESVIWGRQPFGITFYAYGIATLPVLGAAALSGNLDALAGLGYPAREFGFYEVWHTTPEWIWSWSLVLARFVNVLFAVGCVYLTYRIGTSLRGRSTGRLAAAFLAVTWGLLTLAHEAGEDVIGTFGLLLSLYLLSRYVETGERRPFYAACLVGGLAIAVKLSAGLIVPVIGLAHVLRTYKTGGNWRSVLAERPLLERGIALGAIGIAIGFPSLLMGGFLTFADRIVGNPAHRVVVANGPDAPVWWWFLRGYFSAFGLPLFFAGVAGVGAALVGFRDRWPDVDGSSVLLAYLAVHLLVLSGWHDFRPHHLLPTLPLILVFLASGLVGLRDRRPAIARAAVAVLLLTSGVYAGTGSLGYGSTPHDQAVDWMDDNVDRNATMEFYVRGVDEAAVPHWLDVQYPYAGDGPSELEPCPEYIQLTYRDLLYLRDIPESQRSMYVRLNTERRAAHVRSLLNGSAGYEIVAEFGTRPPDFVPDRPRGGSLADLLPLGIYPHTDQYGDEQDLRANQYVAILRYTGTCEEPLSRPA